MSLPMQHIIQHLFNAESLSTVPRERLEELVEEYPSFGVAHYLLSRKLHAEGNEHFTEETLKTNLYFSNPFWLQWLLKNGGEENTAVATPEIPHMQEAEEGTPLPTDGPAPEEIGLSTEEPAVTEEIVPGEIGLSKEEPAPPEEVITPADGPAEGPAEEEEVAFSPEAPEPHSGDEPTTEFVSGPAPAEGPSAADQLLESIAALRQSHQQAAEESLAGSPAVPAEQEPAVSMVALALEKADEYPDGDPDELPPLPEDSEDSLVTGGLETQPGEAAFTAAIPQGTGTGVEPTVEAGITPPAEEGIALPAVAQAEPIAEMASEPIVTFEPYHTIDYFASQGIKLTLDENPSDKLGRQLKSFTDWLKVMRKLPQKNNEIVPDIAAEHQVRAIAAHSIEGKEIVTETMAEVLVKQGMREKAMEVYRKLSLLDPDKIAYFANKIDQLKID